MKFCVLAIDFDGTSATADVLHPDVRAVLAELRSQNIVVVLATGRILSDLQRVAGDLHFADAVVAENGAVVAFPDSNHTRALGPPPPETFLATLRQDGIGHEAGEVVVEADAEEAPRILAVIRRLELPLIIAFNRGRMMVLPQTVSKAAGIRMALDMLRLSPHNAMAIGDAENDHELLRACEFGVAVGWGSDALKAAADHVLAGAGPQAIPPFIRSVAAQRELPPPRLTRRHLQLGFTDDGQPLSLGVKSRNLLVAGDPKSGKSWVTGLLCEQLILLGYCVCIIDPEGDYVSLEALPNVQVLGGARPLPRPMDLSRSLRHADVSLVIDLSHASATEKDAFVRAALPALATLRRQTGLPHRIIVDEAHFFLHDPDVLSLLDLELNGYTLVTYRASALHPEVLKSTQAVVVTRESDPVEAAALFDLCGACSGRPGVREWRQILGGVRSGEAIVLPITDEAQGGTRRVRLAARLTPHIRHLAKYIDIPVPEPKTFVFRTDGATRMRRARTLRDFVQALEEAAPGVYDGHLLRHDFSKWLSDVVGDVLLARAVRAFEDGTPQITPAEALTAIAGAVRARYEFMEAVNGVTPDSRTVMSGV